MKTKKIIALMLSLAMVLGVVACSSDDASTPAETTAATTAAPADDADAPADDADEPAEEEAPEADVSAYTELAIADVADEGDEVLVYGWNDEFPGLVADYSDVEITMEIVEQNTYTQKLDQVLSTGDEAPDLFVCDAADCKQYMETDRVLAVNDLGIAYSELADMYDYTLSFATDDNNIIKGLAWQACPCGIFYNVNVAEATLGYSDVESVQKDFADWDAVLATCQKVNEASNGEVKAISGTDEVWMSFLNSRTTGWIVGGEVNIDPELEGYFDFAKTLYEEDLTFQAGTWSAEWTANQSNETVLSYWGPMWLGKFSMHLGADDDGDGEYDNATAGDWRIINAPGSYYWGGTWMMASKYCDMKASVAQIMRDIALSETALDDMAQNGEFVNSVPAMTKLAADETFGVDWLGGQNPAAVLLACATTIDNSAVGPNDGTINDMFASVVGSYANGEIETIADAEAAFVANVEEQGLNG